MIGEMVGSYRIVREIGKGGMGRVYLAEHALIGKRAAVKILLPHYSAEADIVNRFFNEARSLTLLRHPGIVDVYDFGHLPNGTSFILMEFLDGESLKALLNRVGRLPCARIVEVGRQIALAVSAAHAKRIIHRDLKPDNIFLVSHEEKSEDLRVKVVDFGIAKLGAEPGTTTPGAVIGTPAYMSPEQFQGAATVDHRADIYSLGCVLYKMASGHPPFAGRDSAVLIAAHLLKPPPPLVDIPGALDIIIRKALAKEPEARFQSMDELARALESIGSVAEAPVADSREWAKTIPSAPVPAFSTTTTLKPVVSEARPREASGSRWSPHGRSLSIGAVAVALLGSAAIVRVFAHKHATPSFSSPSWSAPLPVPPAAPPLDKTVVPAPRRVRLQLSSTPPGAEVYRRSNGALVGRTPWSAEYSASDGEIILLVRHRGYREAQVKFPADRDGTQSLTLIGAAPHAAVSSGRKAKPATKASQHNTAAEDAIADPFSNK